MSDRRWLELPVLGFPQRTTPVYTYTNVLYCEDGSKKGCGKEEPTDCWQPGNNPASRRDLSWQAAFNRSRARPIGSGSSWGVGRNMKVRPGPTCCESSVLRRSTWSSWSTITAC